MSAAERITTLLGDEVTGRAPAPCRAATLAAPDGACSVTFHSVSFSYNTRTVLDDASFTIAAGRRVALTGASGIGKSTILNILLRFLDPLRGEVLIDESPLSLRERGEWLQRVAWLPQKPTIFHGTLRENIRLGRLDASEKEISRAADMACASEFLERLPAGLDTLVGEGGQGLSRGQVQRVALARLFLRSPSLVLLDEPTAHLDPSSAALVSAGIEVLSRGRTLVMATHRGSVGLERTLVVEAGKVRESA